MKSDLITLFFPLHLAFYLFAYGLASIPTRFFLQKVPEEAQQKSGYMLGFFLDLLKGIIPVGIASSLNAPSEVLALTLLFATLGQMFSIWQQWQGRPGLPVLLGGLLFIYWPATTIGILVFLLLRRVLKGSLWSNFLTVILILWLVIFGVVHFLTLGIVIVAIIVLTKDYFKEIFTAPKKR